MYYLVYSLFIHTHTYMGYPGGSDDKESSYKAGDLDAIPESGRSLEKGVAIHSSILAWKVMTQNLGGLHPRNCRAGHDWVTNTHTHTHTQTRVYHVYASQVLLVVKSLAAKAGDKDVGLIPGLGRSSRGGHGSPLQYSCLGNPMDRGTWWATVHRVTKESDKN